MVNAKKELELFFERHPVLSFNHGERLKRPNEKAQFVQFIKSGHIRIHNYTKSGRELSFLYLSPVDYKNVVFGYAEQLDAYYISALTNVDLWRVPKKEFIEFLEKNPQAAVELVEALYNYIGLYVKQSTYLKSGDSQTRIVSFLIDMATKFSDFQKDNSSILPFQLTHQMIADHTGLTRETVSLQLVKLKKEGIIDYANGYIHFYKIDELKMRLEEV